MTFLTVYGSILTKARSIPRSLI